MIEVSVKINCSVDKVWDYFTTPSNWIKWYGGGVKEVVPGWKTGAKIIWTSGSGSPLTKVIPGKEICMSGGWMDVTYKFKTEGNAATIVELVESDPKGGASFTDGGAANEARWERQLQKLKECIERESQVADDQAAKNDVKERGDIEEAKQILGRNNFFGPVQWRKFFGDKFQADTIPDIPWSVDILKKPEIDQPHFLFLGIENLGGRPLDLKNGVWWDIYGYQNKTHPTFGSIASLSENDAKITCGLRWYFMPIGSVEKSDGLSYDQQIALLPSTYEVPIAIERITANILFRLLNSKYLDHVQYSSQMNRVSNLKGTNRVLISGAEKYGIFFDGSSWGDKPRDGIGLTASRKI